MPSRPDVSSRADTLPATAHDRLSDDPRPESEPPDPLIGSHVGRYRIEQLLGRGGMGSVYRGVHPRIGTRVAIKVLHPSLARSSTVVERFEREARASGAIGSPYIPKFYDFGALDDGCVYAVLDFYDGESVADRLERGPIPTELTATLLQQAARALGDAHRQGIIHRDIKPDNLFIVRDADGVESIRVLDFGIAKISHDRDLTHKGMFLGTPHYCAPEQLRAKDPDAAMDIYALGSTAYEMLTGEPPYDGDLQRLMHRKISGELPRAELLAPFPEVVRDTVLRAMAFEPTERHVSMAELEQAIGAWLEPPEVESARGFPNWAVALVIAALAIAGAIGAAVALAPATETAETPAVVPIVAPVPSVESAESAMQAETATVETAETAETVETEAMQPRAERSERSERRRREGMRAAEADPEMDMQASMRAGWAAWEEQ